jgi:putative antitoxin of VapBC-like toxin-antitoxin system
MKRNRRAGNLLTDVEVDEDLFHRAWRLMPGEATMQELFEEALRTFVRLHESRAANPR